MKNIGKVSREWLHEVGIHDLGELKKLGSVHVYNMIKLNHPEKVSLNLLWALEGAVQDIDWTEIPGEGKEELKRRALKI